MRMSHANRATDLGTPPMSSHEDSQAGPVSNRTRHESEDTHSHKDTAKISILSTITVAQARTLCRTSFPAPSTQSTAKRGAYRVVSLVMSPWTPPRPTLSSTPTRSSYKTLPECHPLCSGRKARVEDHGPGVIRARQIPRWKDMTRRNCHRPRSGSGRRERRGGRGKEGEERVAKWNARSRGGMTKRDALSECKVETAGCAAEGGEALRDPRDKGTRRLYPPTSMAVENHMSEADAVLVGCVVVIGTLCGSRR